MSFIENDVFLLTEPSIDMLGVNSDNIVNYLRSEHTAKNNQFAQRIDLRNFSQVIQYVYEQSRLGYYHAEQERQRLLTEGQEVDINSHSPAVQKMLVGLIQDSVDFANTQVPVERGSVIYWDESMHTLDFTDISFGEHRRVDIPVVDVYFKGNIPLLPIHTHPTNVIFSPEDYWSMITDVLQNGNRIVKAEMVLCPDIQVLAFATRRTPLLDFDSSEALIASLKKQFESRDSERLKTLHNRTDIKYVVHDRLRFVREGVEEITSIDIRRQRGELTEDEANTLMQNVKQKALQASDLYSQKTERVYKKTHDKYYQAANKTTVEGLWEIAQFMGVKLFSSSDMQHFTEFTA